MCPYCLGTGLEMTETPLASVCRYCLGERSFLAKRRVIDHMTAVDRESNRLAQIEAEARRETELAYWERMDR